MNYPDVAVPETQHLTVNGAEFRFFYDCYNGRRGVVLEKARRAYADVLQYESPPFAVPPLSLLERRRAETAGGDSSYGAESARLGAVG